MHLITTDETFIRKGMHTSSSLSRGITEGEKKEKKGETREQKKKERTVPITRVCSGQSHASHDALSFDWKGIHPSIHPWFGSTAALYKHSMYTIGSSVYKVQKSYPPVPETSKRRMSNGIMLFILFYFILNQYHCFKLWCRSTPRLKRGRKRMRMRRKKAGHESQLVFLRLDSPYSEVPINHCNTLASCTFFFYFPSICVLHWTFILI